MTAISHLGQESPFGLPSVKTVLRRIWPKDARKHVARAAGVSIETAKNWLDGTGVPRADQLLEMALRDAKALAAFQNILTEIEFARLRLAETSDKGVLASGRDVGPTRALAQPDRGLARTPAARADPARRAA